MNALINTPSTVRVLITGGTGTLGRLVVARLRPAGCTIRVLSRETHSSADDITFVTGDLASNEGVAAAVAGVDVIVHCAGSTTGDGEKTRNLVRAAKQAGSPHLVFISVVGADRVPVKSAVDRAMFGYFASKLDAEQAVSASGLPWTTLRATQFHDLILTTVRNMAKLPIVPVPTGVRFQPIDAAEVADRLAELALAPPAGLVPDLAGPGAHDLRNLLRSYLGASGKHRLTFPVGPPGGAARAIRAGANLALDRAVGHRTWESFLAARLGPVAT